MQYFKGYVGLGTGGTYPGTTGNVLRYDLPARYYLCMLTPSNTTRRNIIHKRNITKGTRGASPRRADARLGFAHAGNDRGCTRANRGRKCDSTRTAIGFVKNGSCLSQEQNKTLDSMHQQQILPSGTIRCKSIQKMFYQS